jgi:hypothetical protein
MRSVLSLVTAPDATLPADGAILVSRHEVYARGQEREVRDEHWKLHDKNGHDVAFTVEDLGSSVERWVITRAADRDLVVLDEAGKKIATLHQTTAKSPSVAAPNPTSLTATTSLAEAHATQMGVAGSAMTLVLGGDPPADARFLTIAITGSGARVHSAIAPKPNQRTFESTAYAHKSCSRGGVEPLFSGERVALTWIDSLGRRSAATQITATKQH